MRATEETIFEVLKDRIVTPNYHPVTAFADLHHIPPRSLVCVAGKILSDPAPTLATRDTQSGQENVGNAVLRRGGDSVGLCGWGDMAPVVAGLQAGQPCFIKFAVQCDTAPDLTTGIPSVELNVIKIFQCCHCPECLPNPIEADTPDSE